jgi:hypothetical protein
MALAKARLTRVRTRSQPFIGLAAVSWRIRPYAAGLSACYTSYPVYGDARET